MRFIFYSANNGLKKTDLDFVQEHAHYLLLQVRPTDRRVGCDAGHALSGRKRCRYTLKSSLNVLYLLEERDGKTVKFQLTEAQLRKGEGLPGDGGLRDLPGARRRGNGG